jgi:hypothetical protein
LSVELNTDRLSERVLDCRHAILAEFSVWAAMSCELIYLSGYINPTHAVVKCF